MMDTQLKKGVLDLCILSLLTEEDYYGYKLTEKLAEYMSINEGTIYPILRKLKEEKLLDTYLQEESGGPPRKYYRITKQGEIRYKYLLNEWNSFNNKVKEILRSGKND